MRRIASLLILVSFSLISLSQRVYYVQDKAYNPNASDMNPGTDINYPWATWQRAFNTAQAGDTVYFREGIWYPTIPVDINYYHPGNSGIHNQPICYFNYPGENPILDCALFEASESSRSGLTIRDVSYIKFRGLTVRNVLQTTPGQWISGINWNCQNTSGGVALFENIVTSGHGGTGLYIAGYDTLYLKNCDSYNNCDSLAQEGSFDGGRADGFLITSGGTAVDTFKIAYISGCRSWNNSDDGWDMSTTKQYQMHDCWTWGNGNLSGGGDGIKLAYSNVFDPKKRRIYNCISAYNMCAIGHANLNDANLGIYNEFINISSYKDYIGFVSNKGDYDIYTTRESIVLKNNLVYKATNTMGWADTPTFPARFYSRTMENVTLETNNFIWVGEDGNTKYDPAYSITDDDFVSLDTAQLSRPRKADGSLPDISFFKLREGSDLIDAGIDVGLPFYGSAPDIGYSEYEGSTYTPGNELPTVTITSPANNSSYSAPATVVIEANANDPDGTIIRVEFYRGGTMIGQAGSPPYSYRWQNAGAGNYELTAIAIDDRNASTTSQPVNIVVNSTNPDPPANSPPSVTLYSPTKNSEYIAPASITIEALASDSDGTISNVEFYNENSMIGQSTSSPYTFVWKNVEEGNYSLHAVATDNDDATTKSSVVNIVVTLDDNTPDLMELYPNPNAGVFTVSFTEDEFLSSSNSSNIITIYAIEGRPVYQRIISSDELTMYLDLPYIEPGIYVLTLSNNEILVTRKFIKY
ncbi:MAG: Ig-like domain-containing protein [Bacteroidales bacterium]|nr:Ig-like domain-containing protein [Bacteroidales bacterium]